MKNILSSKKLFITLLTILLSLSLISAFSFSNIFNFQNKNQNLYNNNNQISNNQNNNQLKVTHEHPFLLNNKWIQAQNLKVGDTLTTINGKKARITNIKEIKTNKSLTVYNLEAGIYSNFVVGINNLIVHNSNTPLPTTTLIEDTNLLPIQGRDKEVLQRQAFVSSEVNSKNIDKLFAGTHSNIFGGVDEGAKGIIYLDIDGNYHVRFWNSGEGSNANNIHHKDALADLMTQEADSILKRTDQIENPQLKTFAQKQKNTAQIIASGKITETTPTDILSRTQGFQFTRDTNGKITRFEVDSGITLYQRNLGTTIDAEQFNKMIAEVHNAIPFSLRGYTEIRIRDFDKLKINGDIKPPVGITILPTYSYIN